MHLTTELTAGTDPKIEPEISRADSDKFYHYANWPVWLKIMTSQAEYLHALQPEYLHALQPVAARDYFKQVGYMIRKAGQNKYSL